MYTLSPYGREPFQLDVARHKQIIHTEIHLLVNTPSDKVSNILQSTRRHDSPLLSDLYYLHLLQKHYDDATSEEGKGTSLGVSLWVNTDDVITAMALKLGEVLYKIDVSYYRDVDGPAVMHGTVGTVICKDIKDVEGGILLDKLLCAGRPLAMVIDALQEENVTLDTLPDICEPMTIMEIGRLRVKARAFFGGQDISSLMQTR
jgi:hypothetical protein